MMYRLGRWLSGLTDFTTLIGGLAIALMMLHITADVVLRFLFSSPPPGTITYVSNYYMVIAAFVPHTSLCMKPARSVITKSSQLFIRPRTR